jgi:hypothetical protein
MLPPIISVGRWTAVIILLNHIIRLKIINIIPKYINFLSLFFIPRIKEEIAIHIDSAAWSDGKLLVGKKLCSIVSCLRSLSHRIKFGLVLFTKNWIHKFMIILRIVHIKINNAEFL